MKIVLSTVGKFHAFDLARELYSHGALETIFTGYPRFKLLNEELPQDLIKSFPWIQGTYTAFPWKQFLPNSLIWQLKHLSDTTFSSYVARNIPECDLYVGLSGSAIKAGLKVHQRGARYICDRGSSHIRVQDQLLREEHDSWGMPFPGIDPRTIAREEAEYAEADRITVPSTFAFRSFIEQGVPAEKLRLLTYGVNASRFHPVEVPAHGRFDVLFVGGMSLQKGIQYLIQAYLKVNHPFKSLTFVGTPSQHLVNLFKKRGLWSPNIRVLGHMPQPELKNVMSRSHVLVLPSIQDGFGMVMAQAMACGCPVIASRNTGGEDLFNNGCEGFTVPIRDVDALVESMQYLADNPDERSSMGQRAITQVQKIGGWQSYGEKAMAIYSETLEK